MLPLAVPKPGIATNAYRLWPLTSHLHQVPHVPVTGKQPGAPVVHHAPPPVFRDAGVQRGDDGRHRLSSRAASDSAMGTSSIISPFRAGARRAEHRGLGGRGPHAPRQTSRPESLSRLATLNRSFMALLLGGAFLRGLYT